MKVDATKVRMGDHLYSSEVKFGRDSNPRDCLYLVEGKKMTFREIRSLVPECVKDQTLRLRLGKRFESTMEYLTAPPGSLKTTGGLQRMEKAAKRAQIQAQERAAWKRAKTAGNCDLT